jgi:hypothetical protein
MLGAAFPILVMSLAGPATAAEHRQRRSRLRSRGRNEPNGRLWQILLI